MVGTHARRRSAYSAAKTGVRKVANGEQRRESVGSPTWLTNGQSALHHRWISSWFPARYTAFAFTHERDGREKERERERKKKAGECTREQRASYKFAKEGERKANDGRRKKEEERRVCIASRLPLYPGRQRGEGEGQKEGHNMPNERAPWTSRCGLAKERRAWKEGASQGERERVRRKEEGGEFLGHAASRREGERRTWRTRASLKLGAIGESHFCEDTPAGLHRRRFLRSSC